jgi:hypothetical protein
MIFIDPLKTFDRLWDKIAKAKLPKALKATLLIMVTSSMLLQSFIMLFLINKITDLVSLFLHP